MWDLAHIGWEKFWLLRGNSPNQPGLLEPAVERCYDAFLNSRASRVDLPLLSPPRPGPGARRSPQQGTRQPRHSNT